MLRYIRKKITRYGKTEKNERAERAQVAQSRGRDWPTDWFSSQTCEKCMLAAGLKWFRSNQGWGDWTVKRGLNRNINNPRRKAGRLREIKITSSQSHGQCMKERQRNEVLWVIYRYILFEYWPHQSYLEGGSKKVGRDRRRDKTF